jgi:hypothetical protein
MSRPARIPDRGDVTPAMVAQRLGLSATDFEIRRPELERRGFPIPDSTTGHYCRLWTGGDCGGIQSCFLS